MQPIRQGDVILLPVVQVEGEKIPHLTLASGEVTGHKHRITVGEAVLSQKDDILYLCVFSDKALLAHEEHKSISIPQGNCMVRIQREYQALDSMGIFQGFYSFPATSGRTNVT